MLNTYLRIKMNLRHRKGDEILKLGLSEPQNINDTFYILPDVFLASGQKISLKNTKNTQKVPHYTGVPLYSFYLLYTVIYNLK